MALGALFFDGGSASTSVTNYLDGGSAATPTTQTDANNGYQSATASARGSVSFLSITLRVQSSLASLHSSAQGMGTSTRNLGNNSLNVDGGSSTLSGSPNVDGGTSTANGSPNVDGNAFGQTNGLTATAKAVGLASPTNLVKSDSQAAVARGIITSGSSSATRVEVGTATARASATALNAGTIGSYLRGVNSSGADFGNRSTGGGVYDSDASFAFYAARGHKLIRLPFLWERIQPALSGALDTGELGRLQAAVNSITTHGMTAVLDVHNYARYQTADSITHVIGDGFLTNAHLADLWTRLSTVFKGNSLVRYGLMNEPHDMPSSPGAFASGKTLFDFEATSSGWGGDACTVARSTTAFHDGVASLATTANALTNTTNQNFAPNDSNNNTVIAADGVTLAAWVLVPTGTTGTNWRAKILFQDASYSYQIGPAISLTPGTWAQVTWTPPASLLANHKAFAVQFTVDNPTIATALVYVDTVQQGAVSGGATQSQTWEQAAQAAVTAIRNNGDTNYIHVPGVGYSSAAYFWTNHPTWWINDPANKSGPEGHYYFDSDNSGAFNNTYAFDNTAAVNQGYASITDKTQKQLSAFVNGCTSRNLHGFLGEMGWTNSGADSASYNAVGDAAYTVLDGGKQDVAYWAAGEQWGTTYNLSAYTGTPQANPTGVTPTIEAHQSSTQTVTNIRTQSATGTSRSNASGTSSASHSPAQVATAKANASGVQGTVQSASGTGTARASTSGIAFGRHVPVATAAARGTSSYFLTAVHVVAGSAGAKGTTASTQVTTHLVVSTAPARGTSASFFTGLHVEARTASAAAQASEVYTDIHTSVGTATSKSYTFFSEVPVHSSVVLASSRASAGGTAQSVHSSLGQAHETATASGQSSAVRTEAGTGTAHVIPTSGSSSTSRLGSASGIARATITWAYTTLHPSAGTARATAITMGQTPIATHSSTGTASSRGTSTGTVSASHLSLGTGTARAIPTTGITADLRIQSATATARATTFWVSGSVRLNSGIALGRVSSTETAQSTHVDSVLATDHASASGISSPIRTETGSVLAHASATTTSAGVRTESGGAPARSGASVVSATVRISNSMASAKANAGGLWSAGVHIVSGSASAHAVAFGVVTSIHRSDAAALSHALGSGSTSTGHVSASFVSARAQSSSLDTTVRTSVSTALAIASASGIALSVQQGIQAGYASAQANVSATFAGMHQSSGTATARALSITGTSSTARVQSFSAWAHASASVSNESTDLFLVSTAQASAFTSEVYDAVHVGSETANAKASAPSAGGIVKQDSRQAICTSLAAITYTSTHSSSLSAQAHAQTVQSYVRISASVGAASPGIASSNEIHNSVHADALSGLARSTSSSQTFVLMVAASAANTVGTSSYQAQTVRGQSNIALAHLVALSVGGKIAGQLGSALGHVAASSQVNTLRLGSGNAVAISLAAGQPSKIFAAYEKAGMVAFAYGKAAATRSQIGTAPAVAIGSEYAIHLSAGSRMALARARADAEYNPVRNGYSGSAAARAFGSGLGVQEHLVYADPATARATASGIGGISKLITVRSTLGSRRTHGSLDGRRPPRATLGRRRFTGRTESQP